MCVPDYKDPSWIFRPTLLAILKFSMNCYLLLAVILDRK